MSRWLMVGAGIVLGGVAAVIIAGQVASGAQPWGQLLGDNFVFARSIPFVLGLGVVVGVARGLAPRGGRVERRADGALRRFAPGTALLHWVITLGVLLALVSGVWQYLKGVMDVESPVFMPLVYRAHYVGATLMLFTAAAMVTYWLVRGDTALLVQPGQWIRSLRGLAHELPGPLGGILAGMLGLNMKRQPPAVEQFTYYEKTISFPTWTILIGLIMLTGILKAMRYVYPIPGDVLWWVSAIHVGVMVAIAIKLLDHMRYVFAPSRWPLLVASVTTWVSEQYTRARHPGWVKESEPVAEPERQPEVAGVGLVPQGAQFQAPAGGGSRP